MHRRGNERRPGDVLGEPRRWRLVRNTDVNGISGTGVVAYGVQFPDGTVAYRWNSDTATTVVADSIETVASIHGHDGATVVEWLDN